MRFCFALTVLALTACSSENEGHGAAEGVSIMNGGPGGAAQGGFLAFARDFEGYRTWPSFHIEHGGDQGAVHTTGPRTMYANRLPLAGSAAFPEGTLIVKELEVGDLADRKVFAMAKRGGGFNEPNVYGPGAPGWEWFELKNEPGGAVSIVWRGVGPTNGDPYGNTVAGIEVCNVCHAAAKANDFVQSPGLSLVNP